MYISHKLRYTVIENTSEDAFQALWIEIQNSGKSNTYRLWHYLTNNSPLRFQEYSDETLEKLINSTKSVYIMGDFSLKLKLCDFLFSLQSFTFMPTIDKSTSVYNNSATLIDNILKQQNRF